MMKKAITIGDIRNFIKDFPDDIPMFIDDENEVMVALSLKVQNVDFHDPNLDEDVSIYCVVLGVA